VHWIKIKSIYKENTIGRNSALIVVLATILLLISNRYSAKSILIIILFSSAMVSYFTNNVGLIYRRKYAYFLESKVKDLKNTSVITTNITIRLENTLNLRQR
jgi:hypothetical protein